MIEQIILYAAAIILGAASDRFRGAGGSRILSTDWYGAFIFSLALVILMQQSGAVPLWAFAVIPAAYKLGECFGWGEPLKAFLARRPLRHEDLESWQVGILSRSAPIAVMARGAMWGLPIAIALMFINPLFAIASLVSFTLAFILAPIIAREVGEPGQWALMEEIRGAIVMLGIIILTQIG